MKKLLQFKLILIVTLATFCSLNAQSITGLSNNSFTENNSAIIIDNDISISGAASGYGGGFLQFNLTANGTINDQLVLSSAANVDVNGAISVVGSSVYKGNGSGRDIIGSIDGTLNGQNGAALKINFTSDFSNASFETGNLTNWTSMIQNINLGVTEIAGFTSIDNSDYSTNTSHVNEDNDAGSFSYSVTVQTSQKTDGSYGLQLQSSGTTQNGFDVVHGPAVYSDPFEASAGDKIYFDWRAYAGSDDFDAYGYIVNTTTGAQIEVIDATGAANTAWVTKETTIGTSGTYRFVFVNGTWDASGGCAAGGTLYIDNVRVYGSAVDNTVITNIARQVTFENTSDNPSVSTRTIEVSLKDALAATTSATASISLTAVNDAPVLAGIEVAALEFTEGDSPTEITSTSTVADVDDTNIESAVIQITGNYQNGEDVLEFTNTANISGVWDLANGKITLTGSDTKANYQTALRAVKYKNSSSAPDASARTVSYTINDGDANSNTVTRNINLTVVNTAPALTGIEGEVLSYTENDEATPITNTIVLTDDDVNSESAVFLITANYQNGEDVLEFANTANIAGTWDAALGKMTLNGTDTKANYQTALRSVKYKNVSDNPIATTQRTISFTINDGLVNSNIVTRQITVIAVDDVAQLSDHNEPLFVAEGEEAKITSRHLSITDPDDPYLRYQLLTLPSAGTLKRYGAILNLEDDFLQDDIDAGIITYTHDGSEAEEDSFDFQVISSSQEILLTATFTINIVTEDDPPAFVDIPECIPAECGQPATFDLWGHIADPDTDPADMIIEFSCDNENVSVVFNETTGELEVNAVNNFSGTVIVTVEITDQNGTTISIDIPFEFSMSVTGIENNSEIPTEYCLSQNYPNPFNPTTVIQYSLPTESHVALKIYNMLGQQISELVNQNQSAGYHQVSFNASGLTSGIYFYKLEAGSFMEIKKMILLR